MKNILLVFTGGTIGSAAVDGTIDTADSASFTLLQQFQQLYPNHQDIAFKTLQPLQLLSENLAPAAWETLMDAIDAEQPAQFDGIIITHGTDTLSFTAAALSFYYHALSVPILLVSSNYPPADTNANGPANFICAIEFILKINEPGVFVPYRNPGKTTLLHKGNHLSSSLPLSGDFISVQDKSYMQFDGCEFSLLNPGRTREPANYSLIADFSARILMLKPYPGLDYRTVNIEGADAVLHDLYHSGTACVTTQWGDHYSLLDFIKRCKEQEVKVYLAPVAESADAYQSTRTLIEQGAEVIWNVSIEAAYVKLLLAYSNFSRNEEINRFLATDIAGETI